MSNYISLTASLDSLSSYFDDLADRAGDWTIDDDLGQKVGDAVRRDYSMRFASSPSTRMGGDVYGDIYWRPLRQSWLESHPERENGQVLIDSGALMRSFTQEQADGNVSEVTEDSMMFGSDLDYAAKLQEEWPISVWHEKLLDEVAEIIGNWQLKQEKGE